MISRERFNEKIKLLCHRTAQKISHETEDALYNALMNSNVTDFDRGMEAMSFTDDKLNLHNIVKHMNHHMAIRLEKESAELKKKETEENKRFWLAHFVQGECIRHECFKCPRSYCNLIANAAITGIKQILSGERTSDEVHTELADKFPGIGFENHCKAYKGPF